MSLIKISRVITSSISYALANRQLRNIKENGYEIGAISGALKILNANAPISIQSDEFHLGMYGILVNLEDKFGEVKSIQFLIDTLKEYQHYFKVGRQRAERYSLPNTYKDFKKLLKPNIEE
ncbi:hypothetical protein [Porphyromonas levii]|uniref:hypothetical protein n=1 Tax=Porphyromonas levii TaxID=28114 RepID=UPI001BA982CA|nr:hypothetical protein [Porphyromonas levii]